jgi:hypothetical protein
MNKKLTTVLDRLYNKTIIPYNQDGTKDYSKCWDWNGGTNSSGYGMMRVPDQLNMVLVHRVMMVEYNKNMRYNDRCEVLHECGNKNCVNPKHLVKGNIKDRHALQRKYKAYNRQTFFDKKKMYITCEHCGKTEYLPHFKRLHRLCNALSKHKYISQSISTKLDPE